VVIGLLGSFALTRVLASVLFKVEPTDPLTFVTVTFSLCVVALLAAISRLARLENRLSYPDGGARGHENDAGLSAKD
jgi:hypothetical protein